MRIKNSIYNVIANLSVLIIQTILVFVVRIVFVKTLNEQYLGIQGLFTNIIGMLTVADLGIGTAISFALFKPLSEDNSKKVSIIISLLRRVYIIIGFIILAIGLILTPFLNSFVTDYNLGNLELIFFIYLIGLILEYFVAYPEILLSADQKRYKTSLIYNLTTILTAVLQILFLYKTKNFIVYLSIDSGMKIIKFIILNIYIKRMYININFYDKNKISKSESRTIIKNVKSLFLYKIGDYLINGTDNIIISRYLGIVIVGLYNNYLSVATILKNVLFNIINGVSSSFGNLIVKENRKTQQNTFDVLNFLTYALTSVIFVCLYFLFNDFIVLCFGKKYVLKQAIVLIICINFYLVSMLLPVDCVKNAAGLYYNDRYCSLIQAAVNLIVSLILTFKVGLIGVLLGTTISYVLISAWERPYMVYKYIFNERIITYFFKYAIQIINILVSMFIISVVFKYINLPVSIFNFLLKGIIVAIIHLITLCLFYFKNKNFIYIIQFIKSKLRFKHDEVSSN